MWLAVRRAMLVTVVRQATELRGQTVVMRRACYFIGVGSKARDAKEVRVFGLADFVGGRFRSEYLDAMRNTTAGLRAIHRRALLCWLVVLAGYAVALLYVANAARTHAIDLRSLATVLPMLAVTMTTGSVSYEDISLAWTMGGLPDVDRLESELGTDSALAGSRDPDGMPTRSVRFEGVRFRYPSGDSDVLAGVDLELAAGTSTAIVGVNGAGKSTLVSLLSRLRDPTGGRITVDGVDVREFDAPRWQRTVAIMTQEPVRYPMSAYLNVAFGALSFRADRDGVLDCARSAGFLDVVDTLPHGWDTVLSRELPDGVDLSGGQWQRLALARALFATRHGARLLVLDEPTAALDVRGEAQFYRRFLDITSGLAVSLIRRSRNQLASAAAISGAMLSTLTTADRLHVAGRTRQGRGRPRRLVARAGPADRRDPLPERDIRLSRYRPDRAGRVRRDPAGGVDGRAGRRERCAPAVGMPNCSSCSPPVTADSSAVAGRFARSVRRGRSGGPPGSRRVRSRDPGRSVRGSVRRQVSPRS
jgi:ATP-binding cassette subfamily B protein